MNKQKKKYKIQKRQTFISNSEKCSNIPFDMELYREEDCAKKGEFVLEELGVTEILLKGIEQQANAIRSFQIWAFCCMQNQEGKGLKPCIRCDQVAYCDQDCSNYNAHHHVHYCDKLAIMNISTDPEAPAEEEKEDPLDATRIIVDSLIAKSQESTLSDHIPHHMSAEQEESKISERQSPVSGNWPAMAIK